MLVVSRPVGVGWAKLVTIAQRENAMIQLPDRHRDHETRAVALFVATCELAAQQLQRAAAALAAGPPDPHPERQEFDELLLKDVDDALVSVQWFQDLSGKQRGQRVHAALTRALRAIAPRMPAVGRDCGRAAREWPAVLAAFWMRCAVDALSAIDTGDQADAVGCITLTNLADLIEGNVIGSTPGNTAAEQAVREYLDEDEDEDEPDPAELPGGIVVKAGA